MYVACSGSDSGPKSIFSDTGVCTFFPLTWDRMYQSLIPARVSTYLLMGALLLVKFV